MVFSLSCYNIEKELIICICSQCEIANNITDTLTLSTVIHKIRGQFLKMQSTDTAARFNTTEAKQSPFVDMSSPLILHNMECQDCRKCHVRIVTFWILTPQRLLGVWGNTLLPSTKVNGCNTFLQNVATHPPDYKVSQPRRPQYEYSHTHTLT
jgi:hypothetical protein